ncbi:MAG: hypothetical protein ACJAZ0_001377 [Halioglobus sp.]|jgi:hypothetical protein
MTAPALPDVFGNYALASFVEVTMPQDVSWLPQTVGWTWLALATLALSLRFAWFALRKWHCNRYRKEALLQLRALDQKVDSSDLVAAINRVLKLAALVAYSRTRVAQLSGESWVDFLNGQCEQPPFGPEQSQLLAVSSYRAEAVTPASAQQILAASRLWVRVHQGPDDA